MSQTDIVCCVCGGDGTIHPLTIIARRRQPLEVTCALCLGLIDAGLLDRDGNRYEITRTKIGHVSDYASRAQP